jgi:L,D-transpeptidase catalytic domain
VGSNPTPSVGPPTGSDIPHQYAWLPAPGFRPERPGPSLVSRVIRPEQLAAALERLDPRDRELLSLSLKRRVPDEAVARVYAVDPPEVARRRTAAIERLADELGIQRGEQLGVVLKSLLDPVTWTAAAGSAPGDEFNGQTRRLAAVPGPAAGDRPSGGGGGDRGPAARAGDLGRGGLFTRTEYQEDAPEAVSAPSEPVQKTRAEPGAEEAGGAPAPGAAPAQSEPVLEILAPDEEAERKPERERRIPHSALALAGTGLAALLGAAAVLGATQFAGDDAVEQSRGPSDGDVTRHFVPEKGGPLAAPFPSEPNQQFACYSTAFVRRATTLYHDPAGQPRIRVAARTEWNSPRVFGVLRRRGDWLAVQAPELRNGELAWLPAERARLDCVRWSLHADLSKRLLYVRKDGRTVRKLTVATGSTQHPTPQGRFSVTDKLRVSDRSSPYGCCVLALSGHQTRLPASWSGGDRLAVHATTDLASIGKPVSLGCMRTDPRRARWLIETIPLGTPIFIRS